jgi:hypothetical protein
MLEGAKTLATMEREAIARVAHNGVISQATAEELMSDVDHRLDALERTAHEGEDALMALFGQLYGVDQNAKDGDDEAAHG